MSANSEAVIAGRTILLYDSGYHPFVTTLLQKAQSEVFVTMFYISFRRGRRKSPVNTLVHELVNCRKRGLPVHVFLDQDRPDDVYGSRLINVEAADHLASHGVNVYFKDDDVVTHSKVVVVDGEHIVTGSHNWTLNSFFKFHETSLYFNSSEIARTLIADFRKRSARTPKVPDAPLPRRVVRTLRD
jgi:phosphatidylserine/phosphatidylglycerophosphate/cardiolipin synthase-like enzyme